MNRKLADPRLRARIKAATIPQRTWWAEFAGAVLLIVAALETAKVLA